VPHFGYECAYAYSHPKCEGLPRGVLSGEGKISKEPAFIKRGGRANLFSKQILLGSKEKIMQQLTAVVGLVYSAAMMSMTMYGLHSLLNTIFYILKKIRPQPKKNLPRLTEWPPVTIQLPIYNEKYMVKRLLQAVRHLDYPSNRLQIQVLDDSTDETIELVNSLVEEYKSSGLNIELIHRPNRQGYKAGALSYGLPQATGELIAIFDADFIPEPDWLKKTVPLFQEQKLGCLQTRWGHTNRNYNSLTQVEALGIDGHFVVEQTVRSDNNLFLNFNGTAGLWRRACIEDTGGWEWDTLTEDLDLSYRAQMRGWRIGYVPDVVVPAELPALAEAYKKQQFRWAKGSIQVARKTLWKVLTEANLPWYVRVMAFMHITGYFVLLLMLIVLLLTLPVGLLAPNLLKAFPLSFIAAIGPPLLYMSATSRHSAPLRERLRLLPLLIISGFGISLSTSIAVIQGMFGNGGTFVRTPKLNHMNSRKQNEKFDAAYIPSISPIVWGEIALGFYAIATIWILYPRLGIGIVPWMMIYALGYFYIAGLNIIQHYPRLNEWINKVFARPEKAPVNGKRRRSEAPSDGLM
jgi:cellulose synthase/poly-beta-1,6-N-acetylglucosamine synthase-like glycosyltransferase